LLHVTRVVRVFHYSRLFPHLPPIVATKRKDLTMRLVPHMLIAIILSFLHLGLTKTGTYALPISESEPKIDTLRHSSTSLSRLPPESLQLVGREIHNADYGSDEQPQNTTYNSTSNAPSSMSNASSAPDATSPPSKNFKSELAREQSIQHLRTAGAVTGDGPMTKFGNKRHSSDYSDVFSREISNKATPHYDDGNDMQTSTRVVPTRLMRRTYSKPMDYSHENSDCGYCVHYPSTRTTRYAYMPKYGAVPRPGHENYSGTSYCPDDRDDYRSPRRLRPINGVSWTGHGVDGENRGDVSGGGGSRGIRHFDPKDVDRMLAAYAISHGILVD
jgi:hypothetical protein